MSVQHDTHRSYETHSVESWYWDGQNKIDAILNARPPETVFGVRNWLGLVNFSGRFIPTLATTAEQIKKLTRNNVPFMWELEQTKAFEELKQQLAQPETLGYFDPSAQTMIVTYESPVGLGGVLVQKQGLDYRVNYNVCEQKFI